VQLPPEAAACSTDLMQPNISKTSCMITSMCMLGHCTRWVSSVCHAALALLEVLHHIVTMVVYRFGMPRILGMRS